MLSTAELGPTVEYSSTDLEDCIQGLARCMVATGDAGRKDRLWPTDVMVFQTNPLSLAHGACGTALFLHDSGVTLPQEQLDWLLAQKIDFHGYPPGLLSGIAGIAWCFSELGFEDRAIELMRLVPTSPLAFVRADFHDGVAGWGLAALALFHRTGNEELRQLAYRAGEHLVTAALSTDQGARWRREVDDVAHLGFAYGNSGVALFLLYLWQETEEERFLTLARKAMDFEISHAKESGSALTWGMTTVDEGSRPYWLRGGAGVATTLIRFYSALGEDYYLELARRAAEDCNIFFSGAPHLFEGLAGMGEALLDLYLATGEVEYLERARFKAQQVLLYRLNHAGEIAFPGRYLLRISHDFGLGGAGIGLFLMRVLKPGPRRFHDLAPHFGLGFRGPTRTIPNREEL